MLPISITSHPYFHDDMDEVKAKELLSSNCDKTNILFCKTKNSKEFLMCYKASFRGKEEVRTLKFSYNTNHKTIESSSLGRLSTLYAAAQQLPRFLKGFADGQFNPSPSYNKAVISKIFAKQTESIFPSLGFTIIRNNIFSKLDMNSLFNAMQVSKNWHAFICSDIPTILQKHDAAENEKINKHNEMVRFIFNEIKDKLKPDNEGQGQLWKRLKYNDFVVSEPQWYGAKILCRIDSNIYNEKRYLLIGEHGPEIRWMNVDEPVQDDVYEQLVNACNLGRTSLARTSEGWF